MKVPSLAFGFAREVKSRARKAARAILGGSTWDEVFGESMDTADQSGLLLLSTPSAAIDATPHYHVYLPLDIAAEKYLEDPKTAPLEEMLFERALLAPWATLAVMDPNSLWLLREERCRQLVAAVMRHWDAFSAEGARYSSGRGGGDTLWNTQSNLRFALARIGAPDEVLTKPLPAGGIPELVQQLGLRV